MLYRSSIRLSTPRAHLTLSGELDACSTPTLRREIGAALAAGGTDFTIDAGNVTFVDAAGLGALVHLRNAVLDVDGTMAFASASAALIRVAVITGLQRAFDLDALARELTA